MAKESKRKHRAVGPTAKPRPAWKAGPWPMVLAGVGVVLLVGVLTWAAKAPGIKTPDGGQDDYLGTYHPAVSRDHVDPPKQVAYATDPPTSGEHYGSWVQPGFYEEAQPAEQLVHNLEHGNIVVYYDPQQAPSEAVAAIKDLANLYPGAWDGIVAVPRADENHPIILTAWSRMLQLQEWDAPRANAFIDAYRGRGPENPVR